MLSPIPDFTHVYCTLTYLQMILTSPRCESTHAKILCFIIMLHLAYQMFQNNVLQLRV